MDQQGSDATALPIMPTVWASLLFALKRWPMALLAGAILAAQGVANARILQSMGVPENEALWDLAEALMALLPEAAVYAVFGVYFCRRALLGPQRGRLQAQVREGRYFIATVLLDFVLLGCVIVPFGAVALATGSWDATQPLSLGALMLGLAAGAFLAIRVTLIFPAIAVDAGRSLRHDIRCSFEATQRRFWRLLYIFVLLFIALGLLAVLLELALGGGLYLAGVARDVATDPAFAKPMAALSDGLTGGFGLAAASYVAAKAFEAWSGWAPNDTGA